MQNYTAAVMISPDDSALWTALARATLAVQPANGDETGLFQRNATSAAWNGYSMSRTADARADALQRHGGRARPPRLFQAGLARL